MEPRFFRQLLIINGAVPLAILAWDAFFGQLGTNAVNQAIHITGYTSLLFLVASLAVTPLKTLTGWNSLVIYRRSLGLYGFWYAVVHVVIYVLWDRAGNLSSTLEEILTRRYLQVGGVALLLMVPLAVTSRNAMVAWMTPRRWKLLHRLAYLVAILGVTHFYMLVKSDVREPVAFAVVLGGLLLFRVLLHYLDLREAAARKPAASPTTAKRPTPATAKSTSGYFRGKLRVARIFRETPNVTTFRLVPENGGELPFDYRAGQYLNIAVPIGDQIHRRSYTISSSPTRRSAIEITVKREAMGTVSRQLHDHIHEGDLVEIGAPAGRFTIDVNGHNAVLLIGGGVGLTPVMSMLRYLTDTCWSGQIHLFQISRRLDELIYDAELSYLEQRFPNLHRTIVITGMVPDRPVGVHGRLTPAAVLARVPDVARVPVYLCGPQPMMDSTTELLVGLGVPAHQIQTEAFTSPAANAGATAVTGETQDSESAVAADRSSAAVPTRAAAASGDQPAVTFQASGVEVIVEPGQTILDAGESAGIPLSWECRSGICGQCKIQCLSGTVEHDAMDALTAGDIKQGYILACQARPTSPRVVVAG